MTTPERLRRRQYIIEALVLIAITVQGLQIMYSHQRDDRQDKCQADYQNKSAVSQKARSSIADKRFRNLEDVVDGVAGATSPEDVRRALKAYPEKRDLLRTELQKNPVPPYPDGKCE